ncbi:hypothetical protein C8J56DRAFT_1065497 [Mycena floridula]|nr:hypothetical protein C8J56DRAFT_1065497 [Mycena floridula]
METWFWLGAYREIMEHNCWNKHIRYHRSFNLVFSFQSNLIMLSIFYTLCIVVVFQVIPIDCANHIFLSHATCFNPSYVFRPISLKSTVFHVSVPDTVINHLSSTGPGVNVLQLSLVDCISLFLTHVFNNDSSFKLIQSMSRSSTHSVSVHALQFRLSLRLQASKSISLLFSTFNVTLAIVLPILRV